MSKGFLRRIVERERLREERLREIVDRFKVTVILFGSRARGGSTPASDYDLLIIYDDPAELEKLLSSFKDARIPVDVHAFTLEDALNTMPTSTIILDALEEGAVLKESIPLGPLRERLRSLKDKGYRKVGKGWILRIDGAKS